MWAADSKRRSESSVPLWALACVIAVAAVAGAILPGYVSIMGDSAGKLAALPVLIVVLFLLAWSRVYLLLAIVIVRASTETIFDLTRMSIGGSAIGIGGLLNIASLMILALLVFERPRLFPELLAKAWLPFLAIMTLGLALAPDRGNALRLSLQISSTAAVAFGTAYFVRSTGDFRGALKLVVWSSAIPCVFSIWQLATGGMSDYAGEGLRLRSTFAHPNPFAFYLILVVTIVFVMIKGRLFEFGPRQKAMLGGYLFVLIALLLLTKTRSAWGACAAMFVAYAILFERRYLVYLVLAGVAALFVPGVGDRLIDLTQGGSEGISSYDKLNSFAWRESVWTAAISWMTPLHYPTGYGLSAFPYYAASFFKDGGTNALGAHNIYVQIFFELGLAGIAAFLWLYGRVLVAATKLAKIDRVTTFGVVCVIVQFLVISTSDNMLDYLSYNWYLWFVIGAAVAAAKLGDSDAAAADPGRSPATPSSRMTSNPARRYP